jgi:endonuclease/exonuclease/phosphatase family metal-dependent hydrolase
MKYRYFLIIALFTVNFFQKSLAQDPVLHLAFEPESKTTIKPLISKDDVVYITDLQQPEYSEGISGMALDLSEKAAMRSPVIIEEGSVEMYNQATSFSFQVWIRTLPDAIMGTPIAGNISSEETEAPGWQLRTQSNGAWALSLYDGKNRFEYIPMPGRQRINDGEWHQITLSLDHQKEEIWLFLDGRNVAIINITGLGSLNSDKRLVIGGSDDKWEYGSYGQWHAFNGYIDEVAIWQRKVSAEEVFDNYASYKAMEKETLAAIPDQLKIMAWNIWHGGHRYGHSVGLNRVIEIIQASDADIVGLIETYGSGEEIADALGFYYYLISSNLSIMSRFPILETIKAFKPFNFGGARIDLGGSEELIFLNTWLHYLPSYYKSIEEGKSSAYIEKAEADTRHFEIRNILIEIQPLITNSDEVPLIMSGDFNSGSHLDWTDHTKEIHYGHKINWPVSNEMVKAGFMDSYRELHIDALLDPGLTWTPRAATSSKKYGLRDRIDYIYYTGKDLQPISSKVVDDHPVMFPSDHAAVFTVFDIR